MWFIGVSTLIIVSSTAAFFLGGKKKGSQGLPESMWDIEKLSNSYLMVAGPLAGFSVASLIFLANLSNGNKGHYLDDVLGLFMIAFMIFVGVAIELAIIRGILCTYSKRGVSNIVPRLFYTISHATFYLGIASCWMALVPLFKYLQLSMLEDITKWLMLLCIPAAGLHMSAWLYTLFKAKGWTCLTILILVGAGLAVYKLILVKFFSFLWPSEYAILKIGMLTFGVGVVAFLAMGGIIFIKDSLMAQKIMERFGLNFLCAWQSAVLICIGLLWFSNSGF